MRISDWSSAVCSSDLASAIAPDERQTIAFTDVEVKALEQPAAALNKAKVFIGENRCQHRAGVRRDDRKGQAQAWQACCADTPNPCFPVGVLSEPFTTCSIQIGRAHVRTPVTNAHLVCRLLLEKNKKDNNN